MKSASRNDGAFGSDELFDEHLRTICRSVAYAAREDGLKSWLSSKTSACTYPDGPPATRLKGCDATPAETDVPADVVTRQRDACRSGCRSEIVASWTRRATAPPEPDPCKSQPCLLVVGGDPLAVGGDPPPEMKRRVATLVESCASECDEVIAMLPVPPDKVNASRGCRLNCESWAWRKVDQKP